jgi:hypothetical protein
VKRGQYCCRGIIAAALALSLSMAVPMTSAAAAEAPEVKAETAGERAHFAEAFCAVPPGRVGEYKERLRKTLPATSDFDRHWQVGWKRAASGIGQMSALRDHDPQEFAERVKVNCERLKWMAENSLRARPPN